MTQTKEYSYHVIEADELNATDLRSEANNNEGICVTIELEGQTERAEAIFLPHDGIGAVAQGADADWVVAESIDDVIHHWLNDPEYFTV